MTTQPLFATPFSAVDTGADHDFNSRVARLCEAQCPTRGATHGRGRDDFLDLPEANELRRRMLGHTVTVVAGLVDVGADVFGKLHVQAQGWFSIVRRDGHVPAQHFPGASWLAVYCAQAGAPDAEAKSAGVLRLHERRLGSIYRDESTRGLAAPYRYGNHTWTPLPGRMALFPAHQPHEVSMVRSDTPLILVFAMIRFVDPGPEA
jgi:hypothetical protein